MHELEERGSRGEYVTPAASLAIHVALQDVGAVRAALGACIDDETPPLTLQCTSGPELDALRTDPEINRLLDQLYNGARPPLLADRHDELRRTSPRIVSGGADP